MEVFKIKYSVLKETYIKIRDMLNQKAIFEVTSLNSKIDKDLGLSGDDNCELLDDFIKKYELDFSEFDYYDHFYSEYELFNSSKGFEFLIYLPFNLLIFIINTIFYNGKLEYLSSVTEPERLDLTFGDLIVCKLKGEFCLRKNIKIELLK